MKNKSFLFICFLFISFSVVAQDCKVTKFNGDTFRCDYVTSGKTIVCKTKGQDKIKLSYTEVRRYTVKYPLYVSDGNGPAHKIDTIKTCFVPEDGREYTVEIENDSVTLASVEKTVNDVPFTDYYIFNKNNVEVIKIEKTIEALNALKKYFGGHCPEFDKRIVQETPKFKKAKFPYDSWQDLLYLYTTKCGKK